MIEIEEKEHIIIYFSLHNLKNIIKKLCSDLKQSIT